MKTDVNIQPDVMATTETPLYQADLLQHVTDAVITTDLDLNINSWNRAAETIYGWPKHEVIGKRFDKVISTTFPYKHQEAVITHLFNVGNWQGQVIQQQRNGQEVHISAAVSLLKDANGHAVGIITINRPLTELEPKAVKLRTLTKELDRLNKEIEALSYSVSHDLRAPLRAISGFAQIIVRRHWSELNEETQHFLNNIIEASNHLDHLINDLLAYARLGRRTIQHRPVDLTDLLDHVILTLSEQVEKTDAKIELPDTLPIVQTDPFLLTQILTNLIKNAIIYRRPNQKPNIVITCQIEVEQLVIGVADNGLGIPTEYRDKIFNIFQRLHHQDGYDGNGIGLCLVKKALDLLGGHISIESIEGNGSIFWIMLPLAN
ncbi:MAG: PAS domain S-box protein [Anaerolineae bacterium]|nr:PAS domain S-box protein [Anaerolineae bacterium]